MARGHQCWRRARWTRRIRRIQDRTLAGVLPVSQCYHVCTPTAVYMQPAYLPPPLTLAPPFLRPIAPLPPCFQISRPRHFHPSLPQPTRDMMHDIALFRCDRAQPSHVASLAHWVQRYGYLSYHHRVDLALTRSTDLFTPSPRYSAHAVLLSFPFSVVINGF